MPTSNLWLAPHVLHLVEGTGARTALDVGPGYGKFGVLLREYAGVEHVDAVEMWAPYVEDFGLAGIYRRVIHGDVRNLTADDFAAYDLVLLSEVIEHLEPDAGADLLRRIPGWVVISTPTYWAQTEHEVPTEIHRSLWTLPVLQGVAGDRLDAHLEQLGELVARLRPIGARS